MAAAAGLRRRAAVGGVGRWKAACRQPGGRVKMGLPGCQGNPSEALKKAQNLCPSKLLTPTACFRNIRKEKRGSCFEARLVSISLAPPTPKSNLPRLVTGARLRRAVQQRNYGSLQAPTSHKTPKDLATSVGDLR